VAFLRGLHPGADVETVMYPQPRFDVSQLRVSLGRLRLPEQDDELLDVVTACFRKAMVVHRRDVPVSTYRYATDQSASAAFCGPPVRVVVSAFTSGPLEVRRGGSGDRRMCDATAGHGRLEMFRIIRRRTVAAVLVGGLLLLGTACNDDTQLTPTSDFDGTPGTSVPVEPEPAPAPPAAAYQPEPAPPADNNDCDYEGDYACGPGENPYDLPEDDWPYHCDFAGDPMCDLGPGQIPDVPGPNLSHW
jgi:hypothetical protein